MPEKLLILENHDAVRKALCNWLKIEFPKYLVIEASRTEEALHLVGCERPILIVMDGQLDGASGFEVLKSIKKVDQATKIVFLAFHEDDTHRSAAMAAGASAYVSKHSVLSELVPVVAKLLSDQ